MQEKGKVWVEAWNVRLTYKVLKKARQHSLVQKDNSNQIKLNIIKYISSNSTLQCNLIERPYIYKVKGVLGDLWESPQKYLSIVGSEIKILKANGGVKEKGMCLKDQYMGGRAGGLVPPSFCQICAKSPFFASNFGISMPTAPSLSNSLRRLCDKSVRAVALSLHGILCWTNISVCNVSRSHSLELEMIEFNFPFLF